MGLIQENDTIIHYTGNIAVVYHLPSKIEISNGDSNDRLDNLSNAFAELDCVLKERIEMSDLLEISKIIDRHRAKVVITCEETCWCWDVEGAICGHTDNTFEQDNIE